MDAASLCLKLLSNEHPARTLSSTYFTTSHNVPSQVPNHRPGIHPKEAHIKNDARLSDSILTHVGQGWFTP
jgi:hypothetical protein